MAMTATGSVALRIAPSNRATIRSNSVNHAINEPMMAVDSSRPGTAMVRMGQMLRATCRASRLNADSKISVGMNTKSTSSGVRWKSATG